jgi:L-ascorbate metabolism protein UlaG (beta-lactamase superfamily)
MTNNRWYKKGEALLSEIDNAKAADGVSLWFLGQIGFAVKINETIIYIDALLNDFSDESGTYRVYEPPFSADKGINADFFLCTHNHGDHLNLDTLLPQSKANSKTKFAVPYPSKAVLTDAGIGQERIISAKEGEIIPLSPGIDLVPVAAAHPVYEKENGCFTCLGYIIRGNGVCIYHAGDTMMNLQLLETLKKYKPIDIAILPINGEDWERTSKGIIGNMNIQDAVKLGIALDIDLVIPAHYDMMNTNSVNPAHFADEMYRLCPNKKYHIFALGEQYFYKKR